ncbi:LytS/YhcK type 5TM receptor domain-containing protein [Aeromonas schubertii]|uniref:LytS/YhcK type 5TM receptor domain-containing protein n=1 Tax=Aeromonas schubertii TaxID=652 RepID=UPI0038B52818
MLLVLSLLQQMSVFLVIAYLFSKTPLFHPLVNYSVRLPHKVVIYFLFSSFCVMGTYFGLEIQGAIANTRAVGAVLGGLLGGPLTGLLVGLTGGLHRWTLGGFTDVACAISTTVEGLLGGLVHWYLLRRDRLDALFHPQVALITTFVAEALQMIIILLVAKPSGEALELVRHIAIPMLTANALGAALFISMIRDQKWMYEKFSSDSSAKALRIAQRTVGLLHDGFTPEASRAIARIVHEETGVGAVAITDRHAILAFTGIGQDHHLPGTPISSPLTLDAMAQNRVLFADGNSTPYQCSLASRCPLGSVLVIPLQGEQEVIGTIKLYEPRQRLFLKFNRTLGEGIATLLSHQLLSGRLEQQKHQLMQAELRVLHTQVNPHFLFNTLNTIGAITRSNPQRARELLLHLSRFFRKNLKRPEGLSTLAEELAHCDDYLEIELARFGDHLSVERHIDPAHLALKLPSFTLQPLIENAIKHGTAQLLTQGKILIASEERGEEIALIIEDNAGLWRQHEGGEGLGMTLVERRLKSACGPRAALTVECQPDCHTRIILSLPREHP